MRSSLTWETVRPALAVGVALAALCGATGCDDQTEGKHEGPGAPDAAPASGKANVSSPAPVADDDRERGKLGPPDRMPPISSQVLDRAANHRDRLPAASIGEDAPAGVEGDRLAAPPTGRWQFIGPQGMTWSGRVNRVAFSTVTPTTRYLAAPEGGIWKTTDSGAHWQPLSDSWQWLQASSVAVHPTNDNIVLAGTGDFANHSFTLKQNIGVMRSTDGGAHWGATDISGFNAISAVVFDPDNPDIALAATGRGLEHMGSVWRSTNAGSSWQPVDLPSAVYRDLEFGVKDATGLRYLYATADTQSGQVWRSSDRGVTWQQLSLPRSAHDAESGTKVSTSLRDARTVYVLMAPSIAPDNTWKVYKSSNAGSTWADISNGIDLGDSQDSFNLALAVGKALTAGGATEDAVYACGQQQNVDSGYGLTYQASKGTWARLDTGHADCHEIKVDPTKVNGSVVGYNVLIANDGGVFAQTYNSTTKSWLAQAQGQNATLGLTQLQGIGTHPGDLTQIIGGTLDNGTLTGVGDLTKWIHLSNSGDGGWCAFDRASPPNWYTVIGQVGAGLQVSTDGKTFQSAQSWAGTYGLDSANRVYAADRYLHRRNAAGSFDDVGMTLVTAADSRDVAQVIAPAPSDTGTVFVGSQFGQVTRIRNALSATPVFDVISNTLPSDLFLWFVWSLSVHPTNPFDLLVGSYRFGQCDPASCGTGGLYRWRNSAWTRADGVGGANPLPEIGVQGIARDPDAPDTTWYVATAVGVFQTTDAGANWANATGPLGLPNVFSFALDLNPVTRYLTVGTFGRGAWRIKLAGGTFPDLAVTASSFTYANGAYQFSATIKNQGSVATPGGVKHDVAFVVDPASNGTARATVMAASSTTALGAGATRTYTGKWTASRGAHTVRVVVDGVTTILNRISEGNENNNTRTMTIN